MPNIQSAKKRLRQSQRRRAINLPLKSRIRTTRRAFLESIQAADREQSTDTFRKFCSSLDKAAKRGVIKKNTAIRHKTRAAARLRALG